MKKFILIYSKDFRAKLYRCSVSRLQIDLPCHGLASYDTGITEIIQANSIQEARLHSLLHCYRLTKYIKQYYFILSK